jgi:hypothetical protein
MAFHKFPLAQVLASSGWPALAGTLATRDLPLRPGHGPAETRCGFRRNTLRT